MLRKKNGRVGEKEWSGFWGLVENLEGFKKRAEVGGEGSETWGNLLLMCRAIGEYGGFKDVGRLEGVVGRVSFAFFFCYSVFFGM